MGKIVVTEFVSLDGVMEAPGGGEDYEHRAGRSRSTAAPRATSSSSTRRWRPRRCCSGARPTKASPPRGRRCEGEFADKFNGMPKYVVSSTLAEPTWNNTTVLAGDLAEEVAKLKERARRRDHRPRQRPARAGADRARPRRRAAPDGLPGRARQRQAPVRRGERQEAAAADELADGRRRHRGPDLRAGALSSGA